MTAKADRVRALLEDKDLQEAFDNVEREIYALFKETQPSDKDGLQRCRMKLEALEALRANLSYAVQEGDYEDSKAEQEEANAH